MASSEVSSHRIYCKQWGKILSLSRCPFFVLLFASLLGIFSSPIAALFVVPFEEISGLIVAFAGVFANNGAKYFHFLVVPLFVLLFASPLGIFSNPIAALFVVAFEEISVLIVAFATGT